MEEKLNQLREEYKTATATRRAEILEYVAQNAPKCYVCQQKAMREPFTPFCSSECHLRYHQAHPRPIGAPLTVEQMQERLLSIAKQMREQKKTASPLADKSTV